MANVPDYVSVIFLLLTVTTFGFILFASYRVFDGRRYPLNILAVILLTWLFGIGLLAFNGFFQNFDSPPRLVLFVAPTILFILFLLIKSSTRAMLIKMPITTLTYVHIVRVPVELCLWWLFGAGLVDQAMTFEGVNFDIMAGITAPFAGVFLVGKKSNNKITAILWNLICLGLVLNIVIRAISLTPYFYDGTGAQLQNLAVFYFPFVWLPTFVVPVVIFSHLVSLVQLFQKSN